MATRTEEAVLKLTGDAKSGLDALKQVSDALQGLLKDIQQLSGAVGLDNVIGMFRKLGDAAKDLGSFATGIFEGLGGSILDLLNPLNVVRGAIGMVGNALHGLGDIIKTALGVALGNALSVITDAFGQVMQQPVLLAARVGELEHVFQFLGQRAHYTRDELQGFVTDMKALGITTRESLGGLTQMIQTSLDLNRATELGNVARNAAVVSGENTSEAFAGLIQGIIGLNSRVLRNHGAFVNLEEQFRKTAEASDRTTDSFSLHEKQQIALNAVIASGAAVEGAYTTAMENVGKRLRSIPRWAEEAAVALGRGGVPILGAFVDILEDALKGIQKWFDDRRPIFEGFGLAAAEGIRTGWEQVKAFLAEIRGSLIPDTDPAEWFKSGVEIVVSLANGLLRGLTDYVIPAVIAITQAIAGFLMAASPPKVGILSGIASWGESLINEYLKGFTLADFGILDKVGSTIYDALKSAVALGDLAEDQLIPVFQQVEEQTAGLIANFRETGQISEEMLGQIADTLGAGSEELVKYLTLQLEYQQALDNLTALQEEYAEAEAAGFVAKELQDRLATAEEAAETAEEELSWQEAYLNALQEGVDLQSQQLQTMEKLATVISDVATAVKGITLPKMEEIKVEDIVPGELVPDFSGKVDEMTGKISDAALEWKDKFLQAFEPLGQLKERFADLWTLITSPEIKQTFTDLVTGIGQIPAKIAEWKAKLDDVLQWFEGLPEWVKDILKGVGIFVGINFLTGGAAGTLASVLISTFAAAGLTVSLTAGAFMAALYITVKPFLSDEVRGEWAQVWESLKVGDLPELLGLGGKAAETTLEETPIFGQILDWADSLFAKKPEYELAAQQAIRDPILQAGEEARAGLVGHSIVPEMVTSVIQWLTQMKTQAVTLLTQLKTQAIQLFTQIKTETIQQITEMVQEILEKLTELRDGAEEIMGETAEIFETMAQRMQAAIDEIEGQITDLVSKLNKLIDKAKEAEKAMKDAGLMASSPPLLETGLKAINAQLETMRASMGGLVGLDTRLTLATAPVSVGARSGNTYYLQFFEGALSFPNVRDGRDVQDIMRSLDDLASRAGAKASVPGGI